MSFTDEELKRLKELCAKSELKGRDAQQFDRLTCVKIDALLARLEAAENWLKIMTDFEKLGAFDEEACEAWKKAAGK
jgi:hypothetical protein